MSFLWWESLYPATGKLNRILNKAIHPSTTDGRCLFSTMSFRLSPCRSICLYITLPYKGPVVQKSFPWRDFTIIGLVQSKHGETYTEAYFVVGQWTHSEEEVTVLMEWTPTTASPDSKVHGAYMGPTGPRWAQCLPHEHMLPQSNYIVTSEMIWSFITCYRDQNLISACQEVLCCCCSHCCCCCSILLFFGW